MSEAHLPRGWAYDRLKFVGRLKYGDSLATEARNPGDVKVFGSNGPVGLHDEANTQGPVILIGRKGSYGALKYSEKPVFAIDTTFYIDRRSSDADLRWLYYALQTLGLNHSSQDTGVPGLSREIAENFSVLVPPVEEQQTIARFLDYRTTQLDGLIEKKRQLLDKLAEKRSALITRAVTRGLDPDAPMKDSGVPWLGEIPAHWRADRSLKYLMKAVGGCTPSTTEPRYWDGVVPWVSPKDMKSFDLEDSEDHVSEDALTETSLKYVPSETLLIVVRGMILAHTFPVALNSVPVTLNQDMKGLRFIEGALPRFFAYVFGSSALILARKG